MSHLEAHPELNVNLGAGTFEAQTVQWKVLQVFQKSF